MQKLIHNKRRIQPATILLVSQGGGWNHFEEAPAMREFLGVLRLHYFPHLFLLDWAGQMQLALLEATLNCTNNIWSSIVAVKLRKSTDSQGCSWNHVFAAAKSLAWSKHGEGSARHGQRRMRYYIKRPADKQSIAVAVALKTRIVCSVHS